LPAVDEKKIEEKEKKALEKAKEERKQYNPDATLEGRVIYNEMNRRVGCEWRGTSIFIPNLSITIDPPYTAESCRGGDEKSLDWIKSTVRLIISR